ncbi:MAG TPA: DUF3445 domain-containing protein [Acidimicrobiales bacterium]|nr:DUF3445 domain-containing protein [Acidimicrobiales bacterium]
MALAYTSLDSKGWRLAMGLRPLADSRWFEPDLRRERELAAKASLLRTSRDAVVALGPEGRDASEELFTLVREFLATHYPGIETAVEADEHPIIAASRLVQDDLCVLVRDGRWRLAAACVCFPSRWDLATKIGASLDDIHAPVPLYGDRLASPVNALFDRMTPERAFWRLNWTLLDDEALHQPHGARTNVERPLDEWSFRVERQTLRQLPETRAIVFTIRTYVASLAAMQREDDAFAQNLSRAIAEAPEEVKEYKGWRDVARRLEERLERGA